MKKKTKKKQKKKKKKKKKKRKKKKKKKLYPPRSAGALGLRGPSLRWRVDGNRPKNCPAWELGSCPLQGCVGVSRSIRAGVREL